MDAIETYERDGLTIEIHYDEHDSGHADPRTHDGNLGVMFCDYRGYTLGDEDAPDPRDQEFTCPKCQGSGESSQYEVVDRRAYGRERVRGGFATLALAEAYMELCAPEEDAQWYCEPEECDACEGSGVIDANPLEWLVSEHGARVILPLFVYEHSGITMRTGGNLLTGADNMVSRGRFVGDGAGWDTSTVGVIFDTEETRKACGCEDLTPEKIEKQLDDEVEQYAAYIEGRVYGYIIKDAEGETLDSCWGFLETEWDWEKTYVYEQAMEQADYHVEQAKLEAIEAHRWACADVVTV